MWLVSNLFQDYCKETEIIPAIRTDHSAITLTLENFSSPKGKGYWKFNNSFLKDDEFVQAVRDKYVDWEEEAEILSDKRKIWEYIKYKIRAFSIKYGKQKAKKSRDREQDLTEKHQELEENLIERKIRLDWKK